MDDALPTASIVTRFHHKEFPDHSPRCLSHSCFNPMVPQQYRHRILPLTNAEEGTLVAAMTVPVSELSDSSDAANIHGVGPCTATTSPGWICAFSAVDTAALVQELPLLRLKYLRELHGFVIYVQLIYPPATGACNTRFEFHLLCPLSRYP